MDQEPGNQEKHRHRRRAVERGLAQHVEQFVKQRVGLDEAIDREACPMRKRHPHGSHEPQCIQAEKFSSAGLSRIRRRGIGRDKNRCIGSHLAIRLVEPNAFSSEPHPAKRPPHTSG